MLGSPELILNTLLPIVSGLAVLAYARASTWQRKQVALAIGTFLLGMIPASTNFAKPGLSPSLDIAAELFWVVLGISVLALIRLFVIIAIPLIFVRHQLGGKIPEPAR